MGNYYSYMRISTKEISDKQSFNRQEKSLQAYAKDKKIEYLLSFKDDVSGSMDLCQYSRHIFLVF